MCKHFAHKAIVQPMHQRPRQTDAAHQLQCACAVVVGQAEQVIGRCAVALGKGGNIQVLECGVQREFASDVQQLVLKIDLRCVHHHA